MDIKEVEVNKKEKLYTFTENELEKFKYECMYYGQRKTKEYVSYCMSNYPYKINYALIPDCLIEIMRFMNGKAVGIPNRKSLSFRDWLINNRD